MKVREVRPDDIPRLKEIYQQQGLPYDFPDLDAAQFLVKQVVVDGDDRAVLGVACRQTVELYLLIDSTWNTPRWRLEAFKAIHESVRLELVGKGIEDAHCWLPPQVSKSFGRRLQSFGYRVNKWLCLSRETRNN